MIAKMNEPLKGANPTAALTIPKPVREVPIMAASQPNCDLPPFPECPGVQFAHVPSWPGYAVSDDGHVWSCHIKDRGSDGRLIAGFGQWKRMAEQLTDKGYFVVYLNRRGKRRRARVHILVLEAFVGLCPPGMEACHDPDHTRTNNRLSNLRWDTRARNHADKVTHGTSNRGSRHGMARLDERTAIEIATSNETDKALAKRIGVSQGAVNMVRKGITWSHVTGIKTDIDSIMKRGASIAVIDAIRIIGRCQLCDLIQLIPFARNTVKNAVTDLCRFGVIRRDDENYLYIPSDDGVQESIKFDRAPVVSEEDGE